MSVRSADRFDRAAFDAFASEHLAKHKRPKIVEVVVGELPKNFLGKVLRRKLRSDSTLTSQQLPPQSVPESAVSVVDQAMGIGPASTDTSTADLKE